MQKHRREPKLSISTSAAEQTRPPGSVWCSSFAAASAALASIAQPNAARRRSAKPSDIDSRKPSTAKMPMCAALRSRNSSRSASAPRSIIQPNSSCVRPELSAPDSSPDCPEKKNSTPTHSAASSP